MLEMRQAGRNLHKKIIQLTFQQQQLKFTFGRVEDNANLNRVQYSTFGPRYNGNSNNNSRAQPSSILKKASSPPTHGLGEDDNEGYEARNDEVIRRVVEMKQILQVNVTDTAQLHSHRSSHYQFLFFLYLFCIVFSFPPRMTKMQVAMHSFMFYVK